MITVSLVISRFIQIDFKQLTAAVRLTENSEWFSIVFLILFEVNIAAEQKQAAPDLDGGGPGVQAWLEAPCADTKCFR